MTIEDIDKIASDYLNDCESESDMLEVFAVAKEALEQKAILDKIRAEFVNLAQRTMNDNRAGGMWTCIDILDKYKAESDG